MLTPLNLSPEDFSKLHNAKCRLVAFAQKIDGVLLESLQSELVQAIAEIDVVLSPAYAADETMSNVRAAHYEAIGTEIDAMSVWTIDTVEDLNAEHTFGDIKLVTYRGTGRGVHTNVLGPTWKDLFRAADDAIRLSGDHHHIFIEGFNLTKPGVLMLHTGS